MMVVLALWFLSVIICYSREDAEAGQAKHLPPANRVISPLPFSSAWSQTNSLPLPFPASMLVSDPLLSLLASLT